MSQTAIICPHCVSLIVCDDDGFASRDALDLSRYGLLPSHERIVRGILAGKTDAEIARQMKTSARYVRKSLSEAIYRRVGCRPDRVALVLAVLSQGKGPSHGSE